MCRGILGDERQRLRRIWQRGLRAGLEKLSNIVRSTCKQFNTILGAEKKLTILASAKSDWGKLYFCSDIHDQERFVI